MWEAEISVESEEQSDSTSRPRSELQSAARGGAVTLVGSIFSAVMGFALSFVLARGFGTQGSGVVLQVIAAFTIALSVSKLGMDTAAVWIIPRIRGEEPRSARAVLFVLLAWTAIAAVTVSLLLLAATLYTDLLSGRAQPDVKAALLVVTPFLPFGAVMMVALAATRGFGGVLPFNVVGNVAVPLARPVAVLLVIALGGGTVMAAVAWAAPFVPATLGILWLLYRQLSRFERKKDVRGTWRPSREVNRRVLGFALPRTLASALEQSVIWLDVVLVGVIEGSTAAGVYGAASRFVSAGVIFATALRIVVAPAFSAHLAHGRTDEVQELYTVTSRWILLFGSPVYLLLAWFSPTVLSWLGRGFGSGVSSLVVLCLGSLVVLAAGNVQSLLLMSGRSGWGAVNKIMVLTFNVVGNLILIPQMGILGAALTWAASMALDTGLAIFQVRRFTGVRPDVAPIAFTLLAAGVCTSVPAAVAIAWWGNNAWSLLAAMVGTAILILGYCAVDRRRLQMHVLVSMRKK